MKKHLATLLLAGVVGVLGFAVSGVAVAGVNDKPPSPPGQDECEHGNTAKPCKEDPQPDKGKDCEVHGNEGGVNEDHCKEDETPTETTPTTPTETTPTTPIETTPTETTTPTDSTPTATTPQETTPQATVPTSGGGDASPPSTEPSSRQVTESQAAPTVKLQVAAAKKKSAAVLGVTAKAPKPTRQAQEAPLTL